MKNHKNVLVNPFLQPSSASFESVFSILTTAFGHLQDFALQDYIECSLMLHFNKRTFAMARFIELELKKV